MKLRLILAIIILFGGLNAFGSPANAQTWSDKQLEVWNVIETSWQAEMQKDTTWTLKYLHEKFLGWSIERPVPRSKSSVHKWNRYGTENSTTLLHELYPIGIVVHGNTAVVHYFYSIASENRKGERKTTHGKFTDILVKENGKWQFLAWHGGDNPTDE